MSLLDDLADASHPAAWFQPAPEAPRRTFAEVWDRTEAAGAALGAWAGAGGSVGMVLEASEDCLVTLVAAWRCGLRAVSVPGRGRNVPVEAWRAVVGDLLAAAGADHLVVPGSRRADLDGVAGATRAFEDVARGAPGRGPAGPGSFVQCTSGTTGAPRGVELSLDAVAADLRGLVARNVHDEPILCSWLPWSHDMGLMFVLGTWLSLGPAWAGRGGVATLLPERFAARPSSWWKGCAEVGATMTGGPTLAYGLASRWARRAEGVDLSALRVALVGAEPISATVLEDVEAATAHLGLGPGALCPAYGLAEATVAVTQVAPDERWSAPAIDAVALAADRWEPATGEGAAVRVVDCGPPIDGVEVAVAAEGDAAVGPIRVRGAVLADADLAGRPVADADGWLTTSDLGVVVDGRLHVLGRRDDVFQVAGRNVHAAQVEARLRDEGVAGGAALVAVADGRGGYWAVLERPRGRVEPGVAVAEVRRALVAAVGVGPREVLVVPAASLPRTPSGKVRRAAVRIGAAAGTLPVTLREVLRDEG